MIHDKYSNSPLSDQQKWQLRNAKRFKAYLKSERYKIIHRHCYHKRYKPKFNISLKDDKSYKYIVIRNERIDGETLPVVTTVRKLKGIRKNFFGPFPFGGVVNDVLRSIRKVIPFRDCSKSKYLKYKKLKSPCLYGHIGLCSAPCTGFITPKTYRKGILILKRFLSGDSKSFQRSLTKQMIKAAKESRYEEAAKLRDTLKKYEYVTQRFRDASLYIDNPNLSEDIRNEALSEIRINLPIIRDKPSRIECYDISNVSGKNATASMVVATSGRINKSEYRRFRIKLKDQPDDYFMMSEVLNRRFYPREDVKSWEMPNLILVDGGKGQVTIALNVLKEKNLKIPVVGLAKRNEALVYKKNGVFKELYLDRTNEGLKLLQRLRDEAHRFARVYHHLLRLKELRSKG